MEHLELPRGFITKTHLLIFSPITCAKLKVHGTPNKRFRWMWSHYRCNLFLTSIGIWIFVLPSVTCLCSLWQWLIYFQGDNSRSEKTESNSYSHKKPKSTKALLSGLIKVKKPTNSTEKPNVSSSERVNSVPEQTDSAGVSAELKTEDSLGSTDIKVNGQNRTTEINGQATGTGNKPAGALSMLGGYASSSASDSD